MQLNPIASSIIVVMCLIGMLLTAAAGISLWLAVQRLTTLLEGYQAKIDPLLEKADSLLGTTSEKLNTIGEKTEAILVQGEAMTANVHEKVDKTATIVQRTVNAPIIGINSVWAGLSRGVQTFGSLQRDTVSSAAVVAEDRDVTEDRKQAAPVGAYIGRE